MFRVIFIQQIWLCLGQPKNNVKKKRNNISTHSHTLHAQICIRIDGNLLQSDPDAYNSLTNIPLDAMMSFMLQTKC